MREIQRNGKLQISIIYVVKLGKIPTVMAPNTKNKGNWCPKNFVISVRYHKLQDASKILIKTQFHVSCGILSMFFHCAMQI